MAEEEKLKKQIKYLTELINKAKLKNGNKVVTSNKQIASADTFNRCQVNNFSWKQTKVMYNVQHPLVNAKTRTSTNWHTQSTEPTGPRSTSVDLTCSKQIVMMDNCTVTKHEAALRNADNTRANVNIVHHPASETVKCDFQEQKEFYNRKNDFDAKKEQVIEARKQMKRNIDNLKTRIEELRAAKRVKKEQIVSVDHPLQESEKMTLNSPRKCGISTSKQINVGGIEKSNTVFERFSAVKPTKSNGGLSENDKTADCGSIRRVSDSAVEKLRQELKATEEKLYHMRQKLDSVMNESPPKNNIVSFAQTSTGKSPFVKMASGLAANVDLISDISRKPGSTRLSSSRSLQLIPKAPSRLQHVDDGLVTGSSSSMRMCLNANHLSETKTNEQTDVSTEKLLHGSPSLITCSIHSSSSPQFRYVEIPRRDKDKPTSNTQLAKSSASVRYLVKRHSLKKVSSGDWSNQAGKTSISGPRTQRHSSTCVRTKFKLVKNLSSPNDRRNLAQASAPVRQKFTYTYTGDNPIGQVHKLEPKARYRDPDSMQFQYRVHFFHRNLHQRKWKSQTRRGNGVLRHFSTDYFSPHFTYKFQQAAFMGLKGTRQPIFEQGRYQWKRGTQNTLGTPSYKSNYYLKLQQQQMRSRINLMKRSRERFLRARRPNSFPSMLQTKDGRYERLLMINGILYKSSSTSLAKASTPLSSQRQATCKVFRKSVVVKSMNKMKMQAVTVRGVRFKVDISGKKLQRECCSSQQGKSAPVSRVDIGGATFVETKQGVLEKIYDNQIRSVVNRVKQRCIALATAKFRKDNTKDKRKLCLFFCRFGKCSRGDKCPFVHDPDKIAVCTRFLRGTCKIEKCPYSHKVSKEKMPVCAFFLRGVCTREDCPYLHVKVNQGAELCEDFVTGFCSLAEKCPKLHSLICPAFANTGQCEEGKKCRLLHRKQKTVIRRHRSTGVHLNRNSVTIRHAVEPSLESASEEHTVEGNPNGACELKLPAFISLADYSPGELLTQTFPRTKRRPSSCAETGPSSALHIKPRL